MLTTNNEVFALQTQSERYDGIPYSKLDCQGFVEKVLQDCGVRKPDGTIYNWKGSNSMWRNALAWKGTITECQTLYGKIPVGSWVFIVKNDGGEKDRGYYDNQGNATHVGIFVGEGSLPVRDSTKTSSRDGVGYRSLEGFTHVGFPKMINFFCTDEAIEAIKVIRNEDSTEKEILNALINLTKYLKEC